MALDEKLLDARLATLQVKLDEGFRRLEGQIAAMDARLDKHGQDADAVEVRVGELEKAEAGNKVRLAWVASLTGAGAALGAKVFDLLKGG